MIRKLVDFALESRFLILAGTVLMFGWGAISFHNLPVEAYPDAGQLSAEQGRQGMGKPGDGFPD